MTEEEKKLAALRELTLWPNPILLNQASPFSNVDNASLHKTIERMIKLMKAAGWEAG